MTKIQELEAKLEKAQAKVTKCEGTIARHEKQLEKKLTALAKLGVNADNMEEFKLRTDEESREIRYDIYDIKFKKDDIKGANRKLEDARQIAENWQNKLNAEINKEKFLEGNAPQIIKDFLEDWKAKAYEWHVKKYDAYQEFKASLEQQRKDMITEFAKANPEDSARYLGEDGEIDGYWSRDFLNIRINGLEAHLKENKLDYKSIQSRKANFAGGTILFMDDMYKEAERLEWLERKMESEKKAKMMDLITRINKAVGVITDASNLKISVIGNINGIIAGEDGRAKVETVGAGGWNIQCWHYRTLINKIS